MFLYEMSHFYLCFQVFLTPHGSGSKMLRGNLSGLQSRGVFRALPNISEGTFCKNRYRLKADKYFRNTLHLRCLTGL